MTPLLKNLVERLDRGEFKYLSDSGPVYEGSTILTREAARTIEALSDIIESLEKKKLSKETAEALHEVVHRAWILMDDTCEDHTLGEEPILTVDEDDFNALSKAMEVLENLVPEEEGPFWGGYPVSYFLKDLVSE